MYVETKKEIKTKENQDIQSIYACVEHAEYKKLQKNNDLVAVYILGKKK